MTKKWLKISHPSSDMLASIIQSPPPHTHPQMLQGDIYEAQCWEVSLCLVGAMHYSSPEHYCKGSSRRLAIRVTCTHGNKEVYKPACGDDCSTVLETTEAYCGSSQWWLSLPNVKTQLSILHNNQGKSEEEEEPIFSSQSIWPNTNSPSLARGYLTARAGGKKTKHSSFLHSHSVWGRSSWI